MKTKTTFTTVLLLLSMQLSLAQSLSTEVKESIIQLTETFDEIPNEQLVLLDQLAYRIFQKKSKGMIAVSIASKENTIAGQWAGVWFRSGLLHFDLKSIKLNQKVYASSDEQFAKLEDYGFQTRKKSRGGATFIEVDYGSGKWVYKSSGGSDESNNASAFLVNLDQVFSFDSTETLTDSTLNKLASAMIYLTGRIYVLENK